MTIPRKKFREIVFQLLYSHNLSESTKDDMVPMMREQVKVGKAVLHQAHERMLEVVKHQTELDRMIEGASKEYEVSRIQRVEMNVLRLAVFEMLYDDAVPPKVAITEAIRLSKKFSTPESLKFVNAVLDQIYHSLGTVEEPNDEAKEETFFSAENEKKKRED
jgi:transcription antitermination protein NusB